MNILPSLKSVCHDQSNRQEFFIHSIFKPVTVAERSKAYTVFARSEAGIVGSNSTQGMDVWYLVFVCVCVYAIFCVCVQVEVLQRTDHQPKESYQMSSKPK
jgi:hypothetical protein